MVTRGSGRRRSAELLGLALLTACTWACNDGDQVPTPSTEDGTGGRPMGTSTTGLDSGSTTRGSTDDGVGTGNQGSGDDASASASADGATESADGDSTDDGPGDSGGDDGPGTVPDEFPGVEVGLCAPPGEVRYCYTGAPGTYNVGECLPGTQECVATDLDVGEWGPCEGESLPMMEVCDGIDNDCQGEIDDGLGTTMCGMGPCLHEVENCVDGLEIECDPLEGAMPEICDGIDNDCDGNIDDGLGDELVFCGLGACYHSVSACEDGMEPECDPFEGAMPEVCDNIDNDCDGNTDEDLGDLTCGCGACDHTIASCINGFPQVCDPFEGAGPEVCDGIDNDCDCIVDEDQGNWTCGQFECEVTVPQCVGGVPQPEDTCEPIPGGDEICGDGIDNNCDGIAAPCAEPFLVGTDTATRPIAVIWAVDSSGSMTGELATVEAEVNTFAANMAASGSATQLHLIADRGTEIYEICVDPPLSVGGCADNPAAGFWQYDTNGPTNGQEMVHSSNALGRIMQQSPVWIPRLEDNAFLAFIITTDDDGDDPEWTAADGDSSPVDDCGFGFIDDSTTNNVCRWDAPGPLDYTSLAYAHAGYGGFEDYMLNFFPGMVAGEDWAVFPIIGNTGTSVLTGADDVYEVNDCASTIEDGEEYVKLALLTNTQDSMLSICDAPWPLNDLADDIIEGVPNDLYILEGVPAGNCLMINPATITVIVNGIPMAPADWVYDDLTCTLQVVNNVPVVGDNVVIIYENF